MKKTWTFGIFGILLTLSLIGYNFHLQKQVILKEAQVTMGNLLSFVEMDLERSFFGLDQVFLGLENYLSVTSPANSVDAPKVKGVINDLLKKNSYLTALLDLDRNGQILHWNNSRKKPDLSGRDYFTVHQKQILNGLYIGKPQPSVVNRNQTIFGISRAIRGSDGQLQQVLAAILDVKYFYQQYEKLFFRADSQLTISSLEGDVYVQIPVGGNAVAAPPMAELTGGCDPHLLTDEDLCFHATNDGKQLVTGRKLAGYPLLVRVSKTEDAILRGWSESAWTFALLGVFVSVVLLLLTFRTTQYQRRQHEIQNELRQQAVTDPLTGLFNRRYVFEQSRLEIKKSRRSGAPLSLILLDLDYFKEINDNFGHESGDKVLKSVAGLLKDNSRESDIICRFGGEEFLLVLPATELTGAMTMAGSIRKALQQSIHSGPHGEFNVTGSFGVTQLGAAEEDLTAGLRRADELLYKAKKIGRNTVQWAPPEKS